jgi:hypothetical protein
MMNILDRFTRPTSYFRPSTADEFFALRLAQKLNDAAAAAHYASLCLEHGIERMMWAFRRAKSSRHTDVTRRFHVELEAAEGKGIRIDPVNLLSVKVERRSIAVAVFNGDQLDFTRVRQLSSVPARAESSAIGFINWIVQNFRIESAAVEVAAISETLRRSVLTDIVIGALRSNSLPVWQLSKRELFEAFGNPPLRSRKQLRCVILSIWPVLTGGNGKNQALDAAALGLMVQTERLFLH